MRDPEPAEEVTWEESSPAPPLDKAAYQAGYSNALGQLPVASNDPGYQKGYKDGGVYREKVSTPNPPKSYQLKLGPIENFKPPVKLPPSAEKRAYRNELTDTSPMPFGKYKGQPMSDVPASYLHWLWNKGHREDMNSSIGDYIRRMRPALEQENPDMIWD
jgi:uncharacterized protein (DUF3820 family)